MKNKDLGKYFATLHKCYFQNPDHKDWQYLLSIQATLSSQNSKVMKKYQFKRTDQQIIMKVVQAKLSNKQVLDNLYTNLSARAVKRSIMRSRIYEKEKYPLHLSDADMVVKAGQEKRRERRENKRSK